MDGNTQDSSLAPLLYQHKCFYLLSLLKQNPYTQTLLFERTVNRLACKERFSQCAALFSELEQRKIPYAVMKGAALAKIAYGDEGLRHSGDLDLLIARKDIDQVKAIFQKNGFLQGRVTKQGIRPFSRAELIFQSAISHQTAPFVKATENKLCPYINIDVNLDLLWGESQHKPDSSIVLEQTEPITLCGVQTRKLRPEAEFLSLCLHHYKDANSLYMLWTGHLRLSLFSDLFFYLQNARPDISALVALAEKLQVKEYLYYCLYYTDLIFASPLLKPYLSALDCPAGRALLPLYGLEEKEKRAWKLPFSSRLFCPDLQAYFREEWTDADFEKIRLNRQYM